MKVSQLQKALDLRLVCGSGGLELEVTGGYCGDLLSDVMANATKGDAWVTIQTHQNIVAVALLKELAAIILVNGRTPDEEATAKADEKGMPVLVSSLTAYELAGRLYEAGIGKKAG